MQGEVPAPGFLQEEEQDRGRTQPRQKQAGDPAGGDSQTVLVFLMKYRSCREVPLRVVVTGTAVTAGAAHTRTRH